MSRNNQSKCNPIMRRVITAETRFSITWVLVLCTVCTYMWQWRAMPLFPDEVAFSINNSRFFFDDGIKYGLYSECLSNAKVVPLFYYPAAVLLAGIGALPYWELVRFVPFLSIATLMWAVLVFSWKMNKAPYTALLFTAGFIGVTGSGLVLSRPEIYLILHGAICLLAYSYCASGAISRSRATGLLILLYIVSLISFYVHPQGLIFAPLTLILMYRLSQSFPKFTGKLIAILATTYFLLAVWYGVFIGRLVCPESPKTSQFISSMTLPGWLRTSGAETMSNYLRHEYFERFTYFERFQFLPNYQINYLPPTNYHEPSLAWFFHLVNFAIDAISGVILVAFVVMCFCLLLKVIIQIKNQWRQPASLVDKLITFAISYELVFLATSLGHFGLLFYVTQLNFYRVFYLNMAMLVMLLVALSHIRNQGVKRTALAIGIISFIMCGVSAGIAKLFIVHELESGYSGPSIPLSTNWAKINEDVRILKISCGISNAVSGVIVDDKTYDAVKEHRRLIPVTYVGLSSHITDISVNNLIKDIHAKAAVARCDYFSMFDIPSKAKVDDLCCTTFY